MTYLLTYVAVLLTGLFGNTDISEYIYLKSVIQEETTGCGIASVANVLDISYYEAKCKAEDLGIYAADKELWSDTHYVRRLLEKSGARVSAVEQPFSSWSALPEIALLAINHYQEEGKEFWHWVVFKRLGEMEVVLDSASYLDSNVRTDFDAMQPRWYIEVYK